MMSIKMELQCDKCRERVSMNVNIGIDANGAMRIINTDSNSAFGLWHVDADGNVYCQRHAGK